MRPPPPGAQRGATGTVAGRSRRGPGPARRGPWANRSAAGRGLSSGLPRRGTPARKARDPCKKGARGTIWGPLCGSGPGAAEAGCYPCFGPPLAFGLGHPVPGPAPSSLRRGSCAPWPAPRTPPCAANQTCPFTEAPGTFAPILALRTEGSGTVSPRKVKHREA